MDPQNPQTPQPPQPTPTPTPQPAAAPTAQNPYARRGSFQRGRSSASDSATREAMAQEIMAAAAAQQPVPEKNPIYRRIAIIAVAVVALIAIISIVAIIARSSNRASNADMAQLLSDNVEYVGDIETVLSRTANSSMDIEGIFFNDEESQLGPKVEALKQMQSSLASSNKIKQEAQESYSAMVSLLEQRLAVYDEFLKAYSLYYEAIVNNNTSALDSAVGLYATEEVISELKTLLKDYASAEKARDAACDGAHLELCQQRSKAASDAQKALYGNKVLTKGMFSGVANMYQADSSLFDTMWSTIILLENEDEG